MTEQRPTPPWREDSEPPEPPRPPVEPRMHPTSVATLSLPGGNVNPSGASGRTRTASFDIGTDVVSVTLLTPATARLRSATSSKNCFDCDSVY